ncbi:MAG: hypothetical protein ACFFAO_01390 [Candidatus Hermodarchaeota archaeon]
MEVLELKPIKNKKVTAFIFAKENSKSLQSTDPDLLTKFLSNKKINFVTVDFDINIKDFSKTRFAKVLDKLGIKYYQVDIPEYAMGYLYEEIMEKEELITNLTEEYVNLNDRDSYKGQSLKNWIDLINLEIQEKENQLSLRIRPTWIVKKMLDLANCFQENNVNFVHFVQTDICEDICSQVVECLREYEVKVIQYNKKHTIKNIIF